MYIFLEFKNFSNFSRISEFKTFLMIPEFENMVIVFQIFLLIQTFSNSSTQLNNLFNNFFSYDNNFSYILFFFSIHFCDTIIISLRITEVKIENT